MPASGSPASGSPASGSSERGLKAGALGFASSAGIGVAGAAPAYSLAATLGWAVAAVGPQTLLLVPLAFIPMFCSAWAAREMNRADPDCGTSFAWAAPALGPRTGWFFGGWAAIAAHLLALASLAQIAGQYSFLLFGLRATGEDATSPRVLAAGLAWIAVLAWLCCRGIRVSARVQLVLLAAEIATLALLAVAALVKVSTGHAPAGHAAFSWDWLNPARFASPGAFMAGLLLMVFLYWGWDTALSVNEETADPGRIPGRAGVASTVALLGTYLVVVASVQMFAGFGDSGVGLNNPDNSDDVLSPLGAAVFGQGTLGTLGSRLLILMVLTSAAAATQARILPGARTALSMAYRKALPAIFGRVHPAYLTPSFATWSFAALAAVMYAGLNFVSGGNVLADSVAAAAFFVTMYLAATGFACFWSCRRTLRASAANFWLRGVIPLASGLMLTGILAWSVYDYTDPNQSYSAWHLPFWPHAALGGVLSIGILTALLGVAWLLATSPFKREFFSGTAKREGRSAAEGGPR